MCMKILTFQIDKSKYCLDVDNIQEIVILNSKVSKIPNSNKYIEGMCLVRNKTITVFNLSKYLGLEDLFEKNTLIILTTKNENDRPIGLLINTVNNIIDTEILTPQKIKLDNDYIKDVFVDNKNDNNEICIKLELDKILLISNL